MMVKLTVRLSDGRELVGIYSYLAAVERLAFARNLPGFVDFDWENIRG